MTNLGQNVLWVLLLTIPASAVSPVLAGKPASPVQRSTVSRTHPAVDSYVNVTVDYGAQLLLVDAQGRKTGYDPTTAQLVEGVPGAVYSDDSISDVTDDSPDAAEAESRVLDLPPGANGKYLLKVTPTDRGSYNIGFNCTGIDGPSAKISATDLGIAPGEEHSFNVMVSPVCLQRFVSGAFQESGSGLLTYGYPASDHLHLKRNHSLRLVIVYDARIIPSTFAATLDGNTIVNSFKPKPASIDDVTIPIKSGHHVVQLSVDGNSLSGERISATDSFVVDED